MDEIPDLSVDRSLPYPVNPRHRRCKGRVIGAHFDCLATERIGRMNRRLATPE